MNVFPPRKPLIGARYNYLWVALAVASFILIVVLAWWIS
jgi:hypothetical protein